jgi:hypothetical protein
MKPETALNIAFPELTDKDIEVMKKLAEMISLLSRAFEGQSIEKDKISKLINLDNLIERSYYPTYPLLAKQVYLRLLSKYYPKAAKSCEDWANIEAEALIEYKGKGREQYTEIMKAAVGITDLGLNMQAQPREPQQPKRRFWQRKPTEESEFKNQ